MCRFGYNSTLDLGSSAKNANIENIDVVFIFMGEYHAEILIL